MHLPYWLFDFSCAITDEPAAAGDQLRTVAVREGVFERQPRSSNQLKLPRAFRSTRPGRSSTAHRHAFRLCARALLERYHTWWCVGCESSSLQACTQCSRPSVVSDMRRIDILRDVPTSLSTRSLNEAQDCNVTGQCMADADLVRG